MKAQANGPMRAVRRLSTAVWCVCLLILAVHGGCGGGTSGTGVKDLLVSGSIEGGSGATAVELYGPDGTLIAVAAVTNGQWSLTLPDGTQIENLVVQTPDGASVAAPPPFTVVVSAATVFTTTIAGSGSGGQQGSSTVSQPTPTPTSAPTLSPTGQPTRPVRPTQTPTPGSTPTVDPTAYCEQFPNRPGCATATPVSTPTNTPTVDPTVFCGQFPGRPGCNPTPTPSATPCTGRGCA